MSDDTLRSLVKAEVKSLERQCLHRITELTERLRTTSRNVYDHCGRVSAMGELQSDATILDCLLARLGGLRLLLEQSP